MPFSGLTPPAARPLRPWLYKICANLARNRRRAAGRYWAALQRRFIQELPAAPDIAGQADERLRAERLRQAIHRLRWDDRQMLYLRFFLELSVDETAAAAGIAPGTVKSRTSRALGRLRKVIENEFPDLELDGLDGNDF